MRCRRFAIGGGFLYAATVLVLAASVQASAPSTAPAAQEDLLKAMRSQERGVDSAFRVDREVLARLFEQRRASPVPAPAAGDVLLNGERVKVEVTWKNYYVSPPQAGSATGLREGDDFAFFYFFSPANPEVFVKVLDTTDPTHFGIYFAALSDLEWTITMTVVCTGQSVTRTMPFQTYNAGANGELTRPSLATCPKQPFTASGVSSLNGLTGAVTLTAGSNVAIAPSGNGLVISATSGGSGVTSVSAGAGLTGGGTGSVTLSVANQGITTAMIQDGSVTAQKLAAEALPRAIAVSYRGTAAQSIPISQEIVINFDTRDYDPQSLVSTGSNWQFTAPSSGLYHIDTLVSFWPEVSVCPSVNVYSGQTRLMSGRTCESTSFANSSMISLSRTVPLSQGQTVQVGVFHNSSARALMTDCGEGKCFFSAFRAGDLQ